MTFASSERPGVRFARACLVWDAEEALGVAEYMDVNPMEDVEACTYKHVARLAAAGLVVHVATGDGSGGAVAITRAGAREAHQRGAEHVASPSLDGAELRCPWPRRFEGSVL